MCPTELDLPVLASPDQIRRREFVTTRRGYDPDQVREYLEQIAAQVQQMESMLREARLESEAAARATSSPKADPYEQLAERVADVLRTADQEADRIRREASEEADEALREARQDADRVRLDAQAKAEEARDAAERVLAEARTRADRTIAGLATRRDALVVQLASMQERLLGVAHELEATITTDDGGSFTAQDILDGTLPDVDADPPTDGDAQGASEPILLPEADGPGEELWAGTETVNFDIPDIPALELGFDDEE